MLEKGREAQRNDSGLKHKTSLLNTGGETRGNRADLCVMRLETGESARFARNTKRTAKKWQQKYLPKTVKQQTKI